MSFYAAASLCTSMISSTSLFRHPAVGVLKIGSFSTPYLCMDSCSHTCGKACRGTAGDKIQDIKKTFSPRSEDGRPKAGFPSRPLPARPRPGKVSGQTRSRTRQGIAPAKARQGLALGKAVRPARLRARQVLAPGKVPPPAQCRRSSAATACRLGLVRLVAWHDAFRRSLKRC